VFFGSLGQCPDRQGVERGVKIALPVPHCVTDVDEGNPAAPAPRKQLARANAEVITGLGVGQKPLVTVGVGRLRVHPQWLVSTCKAKKQIRRA